MPGIKTSTSFYYRGVPKTYGSFGLLASANYPIYQPTPLPSQIINKSFFNQITNSVIQQR
jgi:hypothetical protein